MEEHLPTHPTPLARCAVPVTAAVLACALGLGYAVHEHHNAQSLAARNQQIAAQLNATHSQLDALVAKVDSLASNTEAKPAESAPVAAKPSPTASAAGNGARGSAAHRANPNDPRFNKLQSQLDAQGKAIDDARSDLVNTRTELSGSIAKTHDELVTLEKKGERSYFEFDLTKSKEFKREGPLSVSLRKANEKRQYADLQLIVEDRTLTQKHVNLYQPAMFYRPDSPQPVEIVINEITKNHIHGYISAPKYKQSELAAASTDPSGQGRQSTRQRLPLPADSGPVEP
jgi:hypothetical protein